MDQKNGKYKSKFKRQRQTSYLIPRRQEKRELLHRNIKREKYLNIFELKKKDENLEIQRAQQKQSQLGVLY